MMSNTEAKKEILRSDYQPPTHLITTVVLDVNIQSDGCVVTSRLNIHSNNRSSDVLVLQGRGQELLSVAVNGRELPTDKYELTETDLSLRGLPDQFQLTLVTKINPATNTSCEGFYRSGNILCSQCEANGFSRITYFLDRPDVLSVYRVSIEANQTDYPVLLANGNQVSTELLEEGRHRVTWEDPHPKPCYLFAMVAGDLACVEDSYTTVSGRDVAIQFYVERGDESRCDQAIYSLKAAMAWDEETYGLEYDLDLYMVVAVSSFNMGAMENKGLNVFNSKYVLASTDTATDTDYELIQAVIGHEYFHNWTGNRVTCRDWFQLSLKEGLTVFREQQFMEDSLASSTQRIDQVRMLRSNQFAEDASPMAHPVRPESYIEVNNFYTLTVYEKGSELIRMMRGLLGQEAFSKAVRHYLEKHDGTAATIDDFVLALSESSGQNLDDFQAWYSQAGTPQLKVEQTFNTEQKTLTLDFEQHTPDTQGQKDKSAVPIPLALSLLDPEGQIMTTDQLLITNKKQSHSFADIQQEPIPVFLRNFSAPVNLDYLYSREDLLLIAAAETDGFSRWDAMQRLYQNLLGEFIAGEELCLDALLDISRQFLSTTADRALSAELLRVPSETLFAEHYDPVPVDALIKARDGIELALSAGLHEQYLDTYLLLSTGTPYEFNGQQVGDRKLKNLCLQQLALGSDMGRSLAYEQYQHADNMTDRLAALETLNHVDCPEREEAMQHFADQWQHDALVFDKWLSLQASSRLPNALDRVKAIHQSDHFDAANPNRIRSLVGSFCMNNMRAFHHADGRAYDWLADEILRLNRVNPQVASRLTTPLCRWQKQTAERAGLMKQALGKIAAEERLSPDVFELVSKALQ